MPHFAPRPISRFALVLAVSALSATLVGCDQSNPGDAEALANVRDAAESRAAGLAPGDYQGDVTAAATSNATTPPAAVIANLLAGDVARQQASTELGNAYGPDGELVVGLTGKQAQAALLAEQMNGLAASIRTGRSYVQARRATEPTEVYDLLQSAASNMSEGDNWTPGESEVELRTGATLAAQTSDLESRIEQTKQTIAGLEEQRKASLADASRAEQEADATNDYDAALAGYSTTSEKRTEAARTNAEIENTKVQLAGLEAMLAEVQAVQAALDEGVSALAAQEQSVREAYNGEGGVSDQLERLETQLDNAYDGEGDLPSLVNLGNEFGDVWSTVATMRDSTVSELETSASRFGSAATQATTAKMSADGTPFNDATRAAFNAAEGHYQAAVSMRIQAGIYASDADVYAALIRLQRNLEAAGESLPDGLTVTNPAADFEVAVSNAAVKLQEVISTLDDNVLSNAQGELRKAGIIEKAIAIQQLATLRALVDASGVEVSDMPGSDAIDAMINDVGEASEEARVRLPRLPIFRANANLREQLLERNAQQQADIEAEQSGENMPEAEAGDEADQEDAEPEAESEDEPQADEPRGGSEFPPEFNPGK